MYPEQSTGINKRPRDAREQIDIHKSWHLQSIQNSPHKLEYNYNQNNSHPQNGLFQEHPFQQNNYSRYQTLSYKNKEHGTNEFRQHSEDRMNKVKQKTVNIFFPFGRDRQKMLKRIDEHLHQDEQQNGKIIEKFRLKALMSKNRGRNGSRFITSYLNNQSSHVQRRQLDPPHIRQYRPQFTNPNNIMLIKTSIGVNTPDFQQLQRRKQQLKQKRRRKRILQESSIEKFETIQKMMKKVNEQLNKNSEMLLNYSRSIADTDHPEMLQRQPARYKTLPVNYPFQQQEAEKEKEKKPKIKYSQFTKKSTDFFDKPNISQALQQLKKYRRKMDSLKKSSNE